MDLRRLDRIPPVKAVMTPFPYSVELEDPILRAEEVMREHGVHHVPVERNGALVGIVSQRDVARLVHPAASRRTHEQIRVRDICTRDPYVVDLNERLDEVLEQMVLRHLGSALVTRRGKLAGIFTVTDACRVLAEVLRARFPDEDGDAA